MKENRKEKRIKKEVKSEVHSPDAMTFSTSKDISGNGIFISTPEPINVGSEVQLSIKLDDNKELDVKGIVRWINDSENNVSGMGIEFINTSRDVISKLEKIIYSK